MYKTEVFNSRNTSFKGIECDTEDQAISAVATYLILKQAYKVIIHHADGKWVEYQLNDMHDVDAVAWSI